MLTGKQRSYLKKMGQSLDPIVFIGKADLTDNILQEMDRLLDSRELIKVKLQEGCILDPAQTANEAASTLGAEFVQAIGRKFLIYRPAKEKEKRKIVLPR